MDRDDDDEPQIVDLRTVLAHRRGMSWRDRWDGPDRYGTLLLLIVLTVMTSVVLRQHRWERLTGVALVCLMLVFALRTSQATRSLQRAALVFAPIVVIASAIATAGDPDASRIHGAIAVTMTAMLLMVLIAIVNRLSRHLTISWDTVLGALCVYLLIGMVFATAYQVAGHAQGRRLFVQQNGFDNVDTIYFSLVALATVGFGDLTMRSDVTRILAAIEALLGQIYLVTMVAVLVSNLGRRRGRGRGGAAPTGDDAVS